MKRVILSNLIEPIFETNSDRYSEWFGYYNYDTLNYDQSLLLCNRADFDGCCPEPGMRIYLGYYNIKTKQWTQIGESDSWNWQQGSMMQWLPGKENKIIYNTSKNGKIVSAIHNETGSDDVLNWPVYGITPDGKHSITLEFERSYWCRAYHYASVVNSMMEGRVYDGDGIFDVDLVNNTRKRIISIQEIIETDYNPEFENYKHWVEHIMISPSGKRFCFLHRFSNEHDVNHYKTRLMIANIDGSHLTSVPGWDSFLWSHFGWKDDDSFVIYTVKPGRYNGVKSLRHIIRHNLFSLALFQKIVVSISSRLPYMLGKRLTGFGKYYQVYKLDADNNALLVDKYENGIFDIDGHPSFTTDGRYMITDSYPDKKGYQRLIIYDTITKKGIIAAKLFAFYKGNPASCDLHPKLCGNNNYLVVDSAYDKRHHMIVFRINWDRIKDRLSDER